MQITGNTVLITGGGTGIGLELARLLVQRDNQVIICGRRADRLHKAQEQLPGLIIRPCDLTDAAERQQLVDWLVSEYPALNILVNNAGIQRVVDFTAGLRDLADVEEEVSINLLVPIYMSAMLLPHLAKHDVAAIINISSGLAYTPLAVVPVYCATKAAIHTFSLSLRFQLRHTSVKVFDIAPPTVPTGLSGRPNRPTGDEHAMSVEAVATGIATAIENDQYEAALGPAEGLRQRREAMFNVINHE